MITQKMKENLILVILILLVLWMSLITFAVFKQNKNIDNHEFYLKEILQNF